VRGVPVREVRLPGPQAQQEQLAPRAIKEDQAPVNVRAQSEGSVSCDSDEILVSAFCSYGGGAGDAKCTTAPAFGLCLKKR
jgi:hypothetical protein